MNPPSLRDSTSHENATPAEGSRPTDRHRLSVEGRLPSAGYFRGKSRPNLSWYWFALALACCVPQSLSLIAAPAPEFTVEGIAPAKEPLPPEEQSAGISKFSFLVYGDTRGRRDGKEIQYEHSLIIDSMLGTIKGARTNQHPVKFVLQAGDAVVNGREPKQWNVSFIGLINRLTREGGIPYFLAPGNHDVTASQSIYLPGRHGGLSNYLAAVAHLIPREGAARRLQNYPTYAFGYGNTFVVAMDSNIASDALQYAWIAQQLEGLDRTRYKHLFVLFHHPPFSSGGHGGPTVEAPSLELRNRYMPLFRKHRIKALFTGHEHLFEHWVERYTDAAGVKHRMDIVVTGGGGAPLTGYRGEPDLRDYLKVNKAEKVELEHLVKPGMDPGDNPYHYLIVRVDGDALRMDVAGVDWGRNFQPYRSRSVDLK